jgi:hypothetical protein
MRAPLSTALALLLLGVLTATAGASDGRFDGRVEGAGTGPGHDFVVGDGLYLSFKDREAADSHYRVCVRRHGHSTHRCINSRVHHRGKWDKVFYSASKAGDYTVRWFFDRRSVARWSLHIAIGD